MSNDSQEPEEPEESQGAEEQAEADDTEEKPPALAVADPKAVGIFEGIMREYHGLLEGCTIRLLVTTSNLKDRGVEVSARVSKATVRERCLWMVDAFVYISREYWQKFLDGEVEERELQRVLDGQLCRMDWDTEGEHLRIVEPPAEFPEIVRRYGIDADSELAQAIAEQLQLRFDLDDGEEEAQPAMPAAAGSA